MPKPTTSPAETLRRAQADAARRALEDRLAQQLQALGIPFEREHVLPGSRKYRYDFAFPDARLLVEVQGGIWRAKGAHNTGTAMMRDAAKVAHAMAQGWSVLPVTGPQIRSCEAAKWIEDIRAQQVPAMYLVLDAEAMTDHGLQAIPDEALYAGAAAMLTQPVLSDDRHWRRTWRVALTEDEAMAWAAHPDHLTLISIPVPLALLAREAQS